MLVRDDGSVVILDFGLVIERRRRSARKPVAEGDSASSLTSSDAAITGTISYMAPEQAAGAMLTEASDWYAVGVMLYEALSGELPFSGDAITILRSKQLREAPDLATRIQGLPEPLRALCMALLRRRPELRPDGHQVLGVLRRLGGVESEENENHDLYYVQESTFVGRDRHLKSLMDACEQSRSRVVVAYVHGRSGSGKSALVQHFLDGIDVQTDGPRLIFRGRCREQESVPYKSIEGIVDELATWLAQLSPSEQEEFVPDDGYALAKVAPIFRRVHRIAEQFDLAGAIEDLAELRQRGFRAFGELLERLSGRHHVVLSIDDLQWGDVDGIEMLRAALEHTGMHFLLLVTYRDEYSSSPALKALFALQATSVDIAVGPLDSRESYELLNRLLPNRTEEVNGYQELIDQAQGSPYFLEELARHVRNGRPLPRSGGLDEILWSRIATLARPELEVIETIAVSGQPVRLLHVQSAAGHEDMPPSGLTSLRMHHLVRSNGSGLWSEVETYHDRIRETILAHIPPDRRRLRHASLAVCLEEAGEASPDTLAVHFESGEMPEKAGHFYELAAQEAAHALAFARAEEFYKKSRNLVSDPAAKLRVVERLVHLYTDLARFREAYSLGRETLAGMDLRVPAKFSPPGFLVELLRNWWLMRGREIPSLIDHPLATDAGHIACIRLLAAIGKAAFQIRPELCVAIMLKMVNKCLKHGHVQDSSIGYIAVGPIFYGGILGHYEDGYRIGLVALDLVERYEANRIRAEVSFVVGYFGTSWRCPAQEAERRFEVAHQAGLATGDLFHVGCASCATVMSQWMRGIPFAELASQADEAIQELTRFNLREPLATVAAIRETIDSLRSGAPPRGTESAEELAAFGSRHFAHFIVLLRLQREYLCGDYSAALETAKESARYLGDSKGMLHGTEHSFYATLTELALTRIGNSKPAISCRRRADRALQRFRRWAQGSPANFSARAEILRGEILATSGKHIQALEVFAKAAAIARQYDQPHLAALAAKLAADSAVKLNLHELASTLLYDSGEQFKRWGATACAARLFPN